MESAEARSAKELFQEALALPSAERRAFLDGACGGDDALREEVNSLLAAFEGAGDFLAEPTAGGIDPAAVGDLPLGVPETIGPYRLLGTIGEGGMGVVLLAEQEQPVRRQVAIKLIKHSMVSSEARLRFDVERQVLSRMGHSHIATIHDAGTTDDGRPYFVMEQVEGTSIGRYCDDGELSVAARLKLFIDVCQGVHHAHQKGIIHRDLKPSNILVRTEAGKPVPKIIDFGIAKAVDGTLEGEFTRSGQLVGTPEFMSPEQALGNGIDTRSDVYSLGVVLYQLLAGELPLDAEKLRSSRHDEAQRMLTEIEPERPSTRLGSNDDAASLAHQRGTDTRTLVRTLRGDLDAIVMMALEKDPAWRYDSAAALALDLRRYLDREPVLARPPTVRYRAQKFIRRHRGSVVGAAATVVFLIVGLAVSSYFWYRSDRNARLANERYDRILRLADLKRLSDYLAEANELWPAYPDLIEEMSMWLDKAEELARRLPLHEATLQAMGSRLEEGATDGAGGVDEIGEVESRWQLENLQQLVDGLREFDDTDPHRGALANVRGRLTFAQEVVSLSLDVHDEAWTEAVLSIADRAKCPAYGGLVIERQLGLVPLGQDPDSGLWEFAHIQSGSVPARDTDGRLVIDEASSLVLVLLPGGTLHMGSAPASLGIEHDTGAGSVQVRQVPEDSLGRALGLQADDEIVTVGGVEVRDEKGYRDATLKMFQKGLAVVGVTRQGSPVQLELDLSGRNIDPQHDPDEGPVHAVPLDPFFISKYEMTQGQWQRFTGVNPSQYGPAERPPRTLLNPVEHVTWYQCHEVTTHLGLTLPTEAQWEYAIRAGTSSPWWTGGERTTLDGSANLADEFLARNGGHPGWGYERWLDDGWTTHGPVGLYRANPWGLHDVAGNVSEWCLDGDASYQNGIEPGNGARKPPHSSFRNARNASWFHDSRQARSASRNKSTPDRLDGTLGLRPARALDLVPR